MANDKSGPAGHKPAPRILLADDDEDAADSLATCLQAHGCEVFIAWAGDEAVSLAEKHNPDILILDVEMARQAKLERTQDTRRKVLLGALVLHRIENDPENGERMKAWVAKELPGFLTRETDKELFPEFIKPTHSME